MFKQDFKRPVVMLIGRKSWVWLGGLLGLAVILGMFGVRWATIVPPSNFSDQPSMAVNSEIFDESSIQFQAEMVKPDVSGENYFVNYRLKRDQFRQETKSMLAELLNSSITKTKEQAQENWLELSIKIQKEGEVENLLKIKGFQDAVADISPGNVTVIVYAPALTPQQVSMIQDIVVRVTKVRIDKIMISTKN